MPDASLFRHLSCCLFGALAVLGAGEDKKAAPQPWNLMEYGPFIADTITASESNIAIKGTAVRVPGGGLCFDADLLRFSAGWTGSRFLDLTGDAYDAKHSQGPNIGGKPVFTTPAVPGWARADGSFADPRHEPFGPLPADWARYRGIYVHGDQAVLSYSVGAGSVLEVPGSLAEGKALTRTIQVSDLPASTMLVAELAGGSGTVENGVATVAVGDQRVSVALFKLVHSTTAITFVVEGGRILLKLPALKLATFTLVITNLPAAEITALATGMTLVDPATLTKGGTARWAQTVETRGELGTGDGAHVVDTITVPEENPWKSRMRFAGVDFFADGRAALSTWNGDVWIVGGLDDKLEQVTWKRFAAGLHHPLGLKVVDGTIYTLCRDGLFRLHDLNGDGEADFYECFNGEVHSTPAFHEFAFDLWTDPQGDFYFGKAGPVKKGGRGFETIADHHGCLLKISKDGKTLSVVATGLRAPNGMSVGPTGEITSGDNEGTWTPTSRINYIKPGGFYGVVDLAHRAEKPTVTDPPLCWMPHKVENSCGAQAWVLGDRWGVAPGSLLHLSYGTCGLFLVAWSQEGGVAQGGMVRFPLNFNTGIMRGRFNPADGQLYVCGLKGWQTTAAKNGGFQRVRHTGKPLCMPLVMTAKKNGVALTFTAPLDRASVTNLDNWTGEQWNYLWSEAYGSPEFSVADPKKQGHDQLNITSVALSADGKTVFVEIAGFQPVMQLKLKYKITAANGAPLAQEFYGTINKLGTVAGP